MTWELDSSNYGSYSWMARHHKQFGTEVIAMTGPYGFLAYGTTYNGDLFGARVAGDLLLKSVFTFLTINLVLLLPRASSLGMAGTDHPVFAQCRGLVLRFLHLCRRPLAAHQSSTSQDGSHHRGGRRIVGLYGIDEGHQHAGRHCRNRRGLVAGNRPGQIQPGLSPPDQLH